MQKEKDTRASLAEMVQELKQYYELQKQYLRYTAAEQLTLVVSKLTIIVVVALVGFVAFIFLGLALVHLIGATLGSLALGYALYGILLVGFIALFYAKRRKWVILPLARLMTQTFIPNEDEEGGNDDKD